MSGVEARCPHGCRGGVLDVMGGVDEVDPHGTCRSCGDEWPLYLADWPLTESQRRAVREAALHAPVWGSGGSPAQADGFAPTRTLYALSEAGLLDGDEYAGFRLSSLGEAVAKLEELDR